MQKIFLDVGRHKGETLEEVLKPAYHFNAVHSFEPQPECCARIRRKFNAQSRTGACSRTRLVWRILTATEFYTAKGQGRASSPTKKTLTAMSPRGAGLCGQVRFLADTSAAAIWL